MKKHVAVVGKTNAGKSTLITYYLHSHYAAYEHSNGMIRYHYQENPTFQITELPENEYISGVYDGFIVVTAGAFTSEDQRILDRVREHKKPFFFVRMKVDVDVRTAAFCGVSEKVVADQLIIECVSKVDTGALNEPHVFLIGFIEEDRYPLVYGYDGFARALSAFLSLS